nr:HID3 [Amsonia hubrichtii]
MASSSSEIVVDLSPSIRVYKDGTVDRMFSSPYVPPSAEDPSTGVSSKDISVSSQVSARIYIPKVTDPNQKLPILVYFHCGGFCLESAFSSINHRYMNLLVSEAKVLAISVEYRLAPEHPLPAAYEDCWEVLKWVASHVLEKSDMDKEPWLINHGNFDKLHIGGDSAGGNIVHHMAMKAGDQILPGEVKILGGFLSFPYFWGSRFESTEANQRSLEYRFWELVYPSAPGGIDNPMINPVADDAPSLSSIGCSRFCICVAEKDELREPTFLYVEALKKSSWTGEVELVDVEGEGHCFQLFNPDSEEARNLIKLLASFINA